LTLLLVAGIVRDNFGKNPYKIKGSEGNMGTDLNEDEILQILKIVDESDFDELCLETENQKLVLRKSAGASSIQELRNVNPQRILPIDSTKPLASVENAPSINRKEYFTETTAVSPSEAGLVPVKAPVLGIFYIAPRPGAPPFVEEGKSVTEDDTVCTIEVMKVFNSVVAGLRGVVAKVCARNGQTVEYGQTLFLIRPEGDHQGDSVS
jgi:acetyl-CoA carboxylase biotin carboxyl carrier protein